MSMIPPVISTFFPSEWLWVFTSATSVLPSSTRSCSIQHIWHRRVEISDPYMLHRYICNIINVYMLHRYVACYASLQSIGN